MQNYLEGYDYSPIETVQYNFEGFNDGRQLPKYPKWLYKEDDRPLQVKDTEEEDKALAAGYDSVTPHSLMCHDLVNWIWDFEDMSARQLVVYAKEEFGIDLPMEADQERLFEVVLMLVREAPQNKNRLVFMAHTVNMKLDETQEEIRRAINGASGYETVTEEFEMVI